MSEPWREHVKALEKTIEEMQERDRQRRRPAKILVVDDDANDVALLSRVLGEFHCDVTVTKDPSEAHDMIQKEPFDFVFLDQRMPKIDGLDLLKNTIPGNGTQFFIVSGFPESRVLSESLELGALYIPKPVSRRLLATFLKPKDE